MPEILVSREGALGHIRLNRPKAINALTLDMIHSISAALVSCAQDTEIAAVLVTGEGERGFCAGGDIRALHNHRASGPAFGLEFFRGEYRLNAQIAAFPKPYIAIMDGITMGGGVGISAHGSVRIVTERTRLAMPETGIGFFPDIGASWLLSHAPGELGTYLALTGQTIGGADAILAGLADHFVPSDKLTLLLDMLAKLPITTGKKEIITAASNASKQVVAPLSTHLEEINRLFRFHEVKEIIAALNHAGTDFARETLKTMVQKSPTGMQVALRLLRLARRSQTLEECLQREYSACVQVLAGTEFYEGVRAALVDKDRHPKWRPASLDEVTEDVIASYFVPSETRLF
jgi:enoyl-CoA hydratase